PPMLARIVEKNMRHWSRSVARLLGMAMLLDIWVVTGNAQTQGAISGAVTDTSGAPIPGATVTVTNTATSGARTTVTNAAGLYTFHSLPPVTYALKVTLEGVKTAEIANYKLDVQQTARRDVALQVGTLSET